MNRYLMVSGIAVLLICVGLSGCTSGNYVKADVLDEIPESYVNLSQQQLDEFPSLKKSIATNKSVKVSIGEMEAIEEFFNWPDNDYFYYNDVYYELRFISAD